MAEIVGSWKFVIAQGAILLAWFVLNTASAFGALAWDKYPFILANLFMSAEAAFATPIILMSQNRQGAIDSKTIASDHAIDEEALTILRELKEKFDGN